MKINGNAQIDLKHHALNGKGDRPKMVLGTMDHTSSDRVEISQTGRELAAGAIEHHAAVYYGSAEISHSLNKVLDGQSSEVKQAVSSIIQFNLVPSGATAQEEDRAALLELGLSQAKYLADRYMTEDTAQEFLATIDQIAKIGKTGTTPVQSPYGAPDEYIKPTDLMQRFDQESYARLNEAMATGGDWSSILLDFARKVPQNPDWASTYRDETAREAAELENVQLNNRFADASTTSMSAFVQDIKSLIAEMSFAHPNVLTRNMDYFAHVLGERA